MDMSGFVDGYIRIAPLQIRNNMIYKICAVSDIRAEQQQKGNNMTQTRNNFGVRQLVLTAMLTAVVVVLQILGNFIQLTPFLSISLVLVPVVIGAALLGPWVGTWLGFVFGLTVLLAHGAAFFLAYNPAATIATVLVKGAAAGLCAGLAYKALEKKNQYLAVIVAAVVCPTVNTGIFLIACLLFFTEIFPISWMIIANYGLELAANLILAPTILRLVNLGRGMWGERA